MVDKDVLGLGFQLCGSSKQILAFFRHKMKPNENEKFYPSEVYKVVNEILSKGFDEAKVDDTWIEDSL